MLEGLISLLKSICNIIWHLFWYALFLNLLGVWIGGILVAFDVAVNWYKLANDL